MNYREAELLRKESIATAAVKTLDLGVRDPVTRLDIIWKKTNSARTPVAHPGKIIKEILICDGADVLFAMNGQDAMALAYYQSKMVPGMMLNYELGQWSMCIASIYFGRWMWDEVFALDPKKFSNVQIKIDHDLALGGSVGTVADLSIYAHVFDEKAVSPKGFLLSKEIYSFLPVANTWYYIDLPTDHPIRSLMWGANECEDGPEYNLANIKLSEADDKRIIVNSETERYMFQSAQRDPLFAEHLIMKTAAADTPLSTYVGTHWERRFVGECEANTYAIAARSDAGCMTQIESITGASIIEGFVLGHIPFGQVYVPFGHPEDEAGHWDVRVAGSGKLSLQAGATPDVDEYVRVHMTQARGY